MKNRSPIAVFFLSLITLGIYSWYWAVKTKGEMNRLGEQIPTAWIWLIPIVGSIWWYWKYSEGVEHVTHEKMNGVLAFVLLYLLGSIGQAIIQDSFNKLDPATPAGTVPGGFVPPAQPTQFAPPAAPSTQPPSPVTASQGSAPTVFPQAPAQGQVIAPVPAAPADGPGLPTQSQPPSNPIQ